MIRGPRASASISARRVAAFALALAAGAATPSCDGDGGGGRGPGGMIRESDFQEGDLARFNFQIETIYDARSTPDDLPLWDDPGRDAWQQPEQVLDALNLYPQEVIADVGAGSGYFTFRLARRVPKGKVFAVDVMAEALRRVEARAAAEKSAGNVEVVWDRRRPDDPQPSEDLETFLPDASCDLVFLANTLYESFFPANFLFHLKKKLRPGGRLAVIDWRPEAGSPAGPPRTAPADSFRRRADEVKNRAALAGLKVTAEHDFLRYQYFLILEPE
ncbi:MAG: class I SAM-dependent methyltransferase [Planctomycetes bacterium]|nr:class I SAM-dependent methyltransferase [Planctomycetota bacterium]